MAQHDYVIANGTGAAVRSDLNGALAAVVTQNSGSTEPTTTYAFMPWADTSAGVMKMRNSANNGWITLFQLDGEWTSIAFENGSAAAPSIYFKDSGTDTGFYSPGADQVGITTGGTVRLTTSTTAFTGTLPWRGQDGTAAAPAISFNSDTDTGIYSIGANQLGIASNGVERANIGTTEVVWNDSGADIDFRVEGDTKANLFKVDAGTDTVSVDGTFATGNVNYPTEGSLSGRSRIINGSMMIDQRARGAVNINATNNGYCTVDRWQANRTADDKYSVQTSTTAPAGFSNSILCTSLSAYTVGSSDIFFLQQSIEGFNFYDLNFGTASASAVTLSFWVRSSLTGTWGGAVANAAHNRSYPFSYTISAANTWEYKTITIPGDTTGTWVGATNGVGLQLIFGLGGGSTRSGTAGAWNGNQNYTATSATSLVGTNGATFYITGVQLEAGSVATPFERRSYGQELALCQRYYEKSYKQGEGAGTASRGTVAAFVSSVASGYVYGNVRYTVTKRATPTVTIYSYNGTVDRVSDGNAADLAADALAIASTTNFSSDTSFVYQNNSGGTISPGGNNILFNYIASAEL